MTIRSPAAVASVALAALFTSACGSGADEVTSSPPSSAAPTTPAPTTSATTVAPTIPPTTPPTTVTPRTPAPTTAAPTTAAPTTAATTVPATTAAPTTPPPTSPPIAHPETFFVTTDLALVEADVASGAVVRVVDEFFTADGVFRFGLRLTPDRSTIHFSEAYEDAWYACESSVGSVGSIDVASGEITYVGNGGALQLSPDAQTMVYLDSDVCLPDPEAPEFWVLTPPDRVVVRDVASGDTTEYVTATPPEAYEDASVVRWADMHADGSLFVQTGTGDVHLIPPGASGAIQEFPVVGTTDARPLEIVGDRMIAMFDGVEGSSDLVSIDLVDGGVTALATAEVPMAVGVHDAGPLLAVADGEISVEPGVDLTVVGFPPDAYFYDLDW